MSKEFVKERLPTRYYYMVGADVDHYYIAYPRAGGRVDIQFFKLELRFSLSYEGYQNELVGLVERYLMGRHDTLSDEEKVKFKQSLVVQKGMIGSQEVFTPTHIELGFVKLNVRTSITRDGGSVTDFSDIIRGAP